MSIPIVQELYKSGLRTLRDLWKAETKNFHPCNELKILFPLEEGDYSCSQWLISSLLECWIKELK
jgi:hypothetical protein